MGPCQFVKKSARDRKGDSCTHFRHIKWTHVIIKLRPFQRDFIKAVQSDRYSICALSVARGNGKSFLSAELLLPYLQPDSTVFNPNKELGLVAGSIKQARIVYRFLREQLGEEDYKYQDAANRLGISHKDSNVRLEVYSSDPKRAMGIVNVSLIVADEPGSWEVNGGSLMFEALSTALGKPGSPLKLVFVGTLAPAHSGWWRDLCERGTVPGTYVKLLQGDPEKWEKWAEIRKCNPLTNLPGEDGARFRAQLIKERDEAQQDSRKKGSFLSYRLNFPSGDESTVLLTLQDWDLIKARPVPPKIGRPLVGLDMGGGRSWSAATAIWPNGRCEAFAVCPGIPSLAEQEKRDLEPPGTYQKLVLTGHLIVADQLRVPNPSSLVEGIYSRWGTPEAVICDRFRLAELQDCRLPCPLSPRQSRWSEASADIRALRKMAKDGPLSIEEESRAIVLHSLTNSVIKNDDQGSCRLVKADGTNNKSRDDVSAALILAAGAMERAPKTPALRLRVVG